MFRIFGPPGTGKTTTLLNMVDKALEAGTPPDRIAF
jgi:KaiC/GvpD/RAD55 family RecA-like ATPase